MRSSVLLAAALAAGVGACAKGADQIAATYVSPIQYESYSCPQLAEEAQRVSARAASAAGLQDQRAVGDVVMFTVGMAIFWPALFGVGGDGANAHELARLKGEMEAVEQASIRKNCGISFQRAPGPAPVANYPTQS